MISILNTAFFLVICFTLLLQCVSEVENHIYIIYMGAASDAKPRKDTVDILKYLRKKNCLVQKYDKAFTGFAALLTRNEATSIKQMSGVVSVFRETSSKLQTTHSWEFLKYPSTLGPSPAPSPAALKTDDIIIGIIDTGIYPESESSSDKGLGEIPATWRGMCMEGLNFTTTNCNRKLIGARFYGDLDGPRDEFGHGTHVASTIAGSPVSGASYYGIAAGTAKGGSPLSRIAMYRACDSGGHCRGASLLKAFDDAIADGVDVLSLSVALSEQRPFYEDPIAIGSFHATERGIPVVCAAGNTGPGPKTVFNVAPWIFTVAATTIDRYFQANVLLGNNNTIKGGGLNIRKIQKSAVYPLLYENSERCNKLDPTKVKGSIVVCKADYSNIEMMGAVGLIIIDDNPGVQARISDSILKATVTSDDAAEILAYFNSISNPVATILPTKTVTNYKPAPVIVSFSSRGPSFVTKNIIKPDIAAPGVDILAASSSNEESPFFFDSGTSMATPHVSGVVATVLSQYPLWSPSAIKSAIMTTANSVNNLKAPITTDSGSVATPFDMGAGELSITGPLNPGLVYETEVVEYLHFLCNLGYNVTKIKYVASTFPDGFSCFKTASEDTVSSMNYPSIAISNLQASQSKKVKRTVRNVGDDISTYTVMVDAPTELQVDVTPRMLNFTKRNQKLSYKVSFTAKVSPSEDMFGSITWTNDKYKVRSPFVVNGDHLPRITSSTSRTSIIFCLLFLLVDMFVLL